MEIGAVFLTALGKFVFMDLLDLKFLFITVIIITWTIYVIREARKNPPRLKAWGFRTDNLRASTKTLLPFALISLVACASIGAYNSTLHLTWHIIPILILYPIWGIIQQFLLISLVAGNLHDMRPPILTNWLIIALTATLFSLVHYPFVWLMIPTFVLALVYGYLFLKERNIYVLGFSTVG